MMTEHAEDVNLPPAAKIPKVADRNWIGGNFNPDLFTFDETNSGVSQLVRSNIPTEEITHDEVQ